MALKNCTVNSFGNFRPTPPRKVVSCKKNGVDHTQVRIVSLIFVCVCFLNLFCCLPFSFRVSVHLFSCLFFFRRRGLPPKLEYISPFSAKNNQTESTKKNFTKELKKKIQAVTCAHK